MTTGKRQRVGDGGEPLPLPADHDASAKSPWYRRIAFWRSVAGMAMAIALGCAVVTLETASELSSRSISFHRRLDLLRSRISGLRTQAADAERQLAAMRSERNARVKVNRVLSAPDVTVLRLRPGVASNARGLLAFSREAGGAAIEIVGLPAGAGQTCVMWWIAARGFPSKAAEFTPDTDGQLSIAVAMPPKGAKITGAIVTLEASKPIDQPKGRIVLKGALPKPETFG